MKAGIMLQWRSEGNIILEKLVDRKKLLNILKALEKENNSLREIGGLAKDADQIYIDSSEENHVCFHYEENREYPEAEKKLRVESDDIFYNVMKDCIGEKSAIE